jgi:hypothetical protein
MADYQDFEVKVTNEHGSLLPVVSGRNYYVVGATNEKTGSVSYVYDEDGVLFGIPISGSVSIPGQGIPCKQIRANAADTWVFYYIK